MLVLPHYVASTALLDRMAMFMLQQSQRAVILDSLKMYMSHPRVLKCVAALLCLSQMMHVFGCGCILAASFGRMSEHSAALLVVMSTLPDCVVAGLCLTVPDRLLDETKGSSTVVVLWLLIGTNVTVSGLILSATGNRTCTHTISIVLLFDAVSVMFPPVFVYEPLLALALGQTTTPYRGALQPLQTHASKICAVVHHFIRIQGYTQDAEYPTILNELYEGACDSVPMMTPARKTAWYDEQSMVWV
ncbi:hypothetical protein KIPB_000722 [Kipferlia bialata]|uniref:Uncharacterized protein n=1 Tax=Kipferlia bialata TaxID=797122 RepID=A0A9K3CPM4_9EUKA|nr:hypothetical protein KIPB_000722 [Kipferlia bialata]|eukprot:g722.t1